MAAKICHGRFQQLSVLRQFLDQNEPGDASDFSEN
jgi:hypothetical protein